MEVSERDTVMALAAHMLEHSDSSTGQTPPDTSCTRKNITLALPVSRCLKHGGSAAWMHSRQDDIRIPRKMVQAIVSQGCCPVQLQMILRRALHNVDDLVFAGETMVSGSLAALDYECLVQVAEWLTFPERLACRTSARASVHWVMPVDCGATNLWLTALDATRKQLGEMTALEVQRRRSEFEQQTRRVADQLSGIIRNQATLSARCNSLETRCDSLGAKVDATEAKLARMQAKIVRLEKHARKAIEEQQVLKDITVQQQERIFTLQHRDTSVLQDVIWEQEDVIGQLQQQIPRHLSGELCQSTTQQEDCPDQAAGRMAAVASVRMAARRPATPGGIPPPPKQRRLK